MAQNHQPSIDEIFDVYSQVDVDASGSVTTREFERFLAGDDLHHTFLVNFDTADIGVTWVDGPKPGTIYVKRIEQGSPANDHIDVMVGLELCSVNGYPLPPGGAKALTRLWLHIFTSESAIEIEFYEPFAITHEFARDLDFEVARSGVEPSNSGVLQNNPFGALFLAGMHHSQMGGSSAVEDDSERHLLLARVPMLAYAYVTDLASALERAFMDAGAPFHFYVEGNEETGALRIKAEHGFRLLGSAGSSSMSMHRLLGFPNEDDDILTREIQSASKLVMSLQLGFKNSHEVRVFTGELMAKYDVNQNRELEFDEFRKLYLDCLHGAEDRTRVRRAVMERFRTNEELRLIAMAEAEAMQLEQRRLSLLAKRDEMRVVTKDQKKKRLGNLYTDCDTTARRRKPPPKGFLKAKVQQMIAGKNKLFKIAGDLKKLEALRQDLDHKKLISAKKHRITDRAQKMALYKATRGVDVERKRAADGWEAEQEARRDVAERRRTQALRSLTERGFESAVSAGSLGPAERSRLKVDDEHFKPHPAFAGCAFRRGYEPSPSPVFAGLRVVPAAIPAVVEGRTQLRFLADLREAHRTDCWRNIPTPPLCKSVARQRARALTAAFDRSEIVHPATWGCLISPLATSAAVDSSPVCADYSMERQAVVLPAEGVSTSGRTASASRAAQFKRPFRLLPAGGGALDVNLGQAGGHDHDAEPCHICLGGAFGCPWCFEFPKGKRPGDFAYAETESAQLAKQHAEANDDTPAFYTDLTTRPAVVHHRRIRDCPAEVLVKSVPCGRVLSLKVQCGMTVGHVHHLFRSNNAKGNAELSYMFLPTDRGLVAFNGSVDALARTVDFDERLANPADVPLQRYGFSKDAKIVLFHGSSQEHIADIVAAFKSANLLRKPLAGAGSTVEFLDFVPAKLPGNDSVQRSLWSLFELQEAQFEQSIKQDELDEDRHQRKLAREAMEANRADALEDRRQARRRNTERGHAGLRKGADVGKLRYLLSRIAEKAEPVVKIKDEDSLASTLTPPPPPGGKKKKLAKLKLPT